MKSLILGITLLLFSASHWYGLMYINTNIIELRVISLITFLPLAILSLILILSEFIGKTNSIDYNFQLMGRVMIFVFLSLYCVNNMGMMHGITMKLVYFNGLNFVAMLILLISGGRHGLLKN